MSGDVSAHLDLDALADSLAGEGDPATAAHLETCRSCTSRLAELEAAEARVVAVLATLPPPAVPADLADRLSAALAAQAPTPARSTVTALPARTRRRSWLPAAAAAVLLVSGAGLGLALLDDGGGGNGSADTATSEATSDLVLNASGTDYADPPAVERALPGVLGGTAGGVALDPQSLSSGGETEGRSSDDQEDAGAPAPAAAPDGGLTRLLTSDGLADCLAALLPPDEPDLRPLALDYATYSGRPALAVVLPDPDPAKLSVFVVGAGCSQADDSTLHFFRVDAP